MVAHVGVRFPEPLHRRGRIHSLHQHCGQVAARGRRKQRRAPGASPVPAARPRLQSAEEGSEYLFAHASGDSHPR